MPDAPLRVRDPLSVADLRRLARCFDALSDETGARQLSRSVRELHRRRGCSRSDAAEPAGRIMQRVVTELRDYRIAEGHLDEFIDAWLRGVLPLRREQGFVIDGAWAVADESRFVWLLSRDGSWDEFEAANAAYYASAERAAVDPDPAQWIAHATHARLRGVLPQWPSARKASTSSS